MGFLKTLAKRVVTKSRASVYERFEGAFTNLRVAQH